MSLRHALLGLLAYEPRTGYGLLKHFEQSLAYTWPTTHSQIYPELARLRDEGLIRQSGSGPRGAKTYEITDEGTAQVKRWLRETEPDRAVRHEPDLRIFFLWLLEPHEAAANLRRERELQEELLAEYEAIAHHERDFSTRKTLAYRLALELGLRISRARIEWAEWAERQVRSPRWRDRPPR